MFVTRTMLSFLLAKKMQLKPPLKRRLRLSTLADKKIGSGSTLKVTAPAPQHWFLSGTGIFCLCFSVQSIFS